MYSGSTLFMRLLSLSARKRLVLVLVVSVVSMGLPELFGLTFPISYFGSALALVCASWLFGWRGGLLCLACLTAANYELVPGGVTWHSPWLALFLAVELYGLLVCLGVSALNVAMRSLLAERKHVERLQQVYEREHALNQWKDQALQDLNHELPASLTQTDGYLELLETYGNNLDAATQARFIALARSGCDELLNLIQATKEMLQASTMQQSLHTSVFSLRHEVHTALAHCDSRLLQNHPIKLDIDDSLQVHADPRCVRQIMRNLLTNACKYTPSGTAITVSASCLSAADQPDGQAGMVCVRVRDEGPGIPPEYQARVFERFTRLPGAVASAQPGSGLGLAICKQLAEAMGGTIWVESTGRDGEGSCFSFTLASGSPSSAPDLDAQERKAWQNAVKT
ncbi:MAG TPA: HAMP domain-containing sensor histidine kinase [Ktedonobacteraceae bacterium]|nr:HAMP domain-containing sensor histidine kinase [Ktedonobacteraceae bacterium]